MELVVDANILIASLLKDGTTRNLLLDFHLVLFAPEHLLNETSRHILNDGALRHRIHISNQSLEELLASLMQKIQTIPQKCYQIYMERARRIAPHEEDSPYLALALLMQIPIWSSDKGLREQAMVPIISTPEIVMKLGL